MNNPMSVLIAQRKELNEKIASSVFEVKQVEETLRNVCDHKHSNGKSARDESTNKCCYCMKIV